MDGHHLKMDDDTFHICSSQYGVMLFPELPRALAEMVRVTKPQGRVVLIAFGPPEEVEFLTFMMAAMRAVVPDFDGLPENPPPLPFQVADPGKLRRELAKAGLRDIMVERTTEKLTFRSEKELWSWLMSSNPIPGRLVDELSDKQKEEVQHNLDRFSLFDLPTLNTQGGSTSQRPQSNNQKEAILKRKVRIFFVFAATAVLFCLG